MMMKKKEQRIKSYRIIKDAFAHYARAGVPNLFNPNEKDILEGKIETALEVALSTNNLGALASVKGMVERTDKKHIMENLEAKNFGFLPEKPRQRGENRNHD